ncbi:MAG: LptF/LptG family permease [Planctomycetota bacterium]
MSAVGTRLHRYIFRQLLVALLFAIGGILLVALPGIAVSTVHRMPFAGPDLLARYLPLVLKTLAPYVLPICFLLAVVATYGRLAADREWTAIQMSGAHPLGMFLPGLLLAALLGAGTYWMVSVDMPRSKVAQRMLVKDVARAALLQLKPGRTTLEFGRFYLRAAYRDKENQNILYKVHIRTPDKDMGHAVDIFAEKVELRLDADTLSIDLYEPQTSTVEKGLELGVENFTYTVPIEDLVGVRQNNYTHPAYCLLGDPRRTRKGGRRGKALDPAAIRARLPDLHVGDLLDLPAGRRPHRDPSAQGHPARSVDRGNRVRPGLLRLLGATRAATWAGRPRAHLGGGRIRAGGGPPGFGPAGGAHRQALNLSVRRRDTAACPPRGPRAPHPRCG